MARIQDASHSPVEMTGRLRFSVILGCFQNISPLMRHRSGELFAQNWWAGKLAVSIRCGDCSSHIDDLTALKADNGLDPLMFRPLIPHFWICIALLTGIMGGYGLLKWVME